MQWISFIFDIEFDPADVGALLKIKPRDLKIEPNLGSDGSKSVPDGARWLATDVSVLQIGPRRLQERPREVQERPSSPKTAPR